MSFFVVLHKARTKQHLIVLEAIYILFDRPSLCKEKPKDSLNLLGDIACLTQDGFNFFLSPTFVLLTIFIFIPFYVILFTLS